MGCSERGGARALASSAAGQCFLANSVPSAWRRKHGRALCRARLPPRRQVLAAAVAGYAAAGPPDAAARAGWSPDEDWAGGSAAAGPALQLVGAMRSGRAQVPLPSRPRVPRCGFGAEQHGVAQEVRGTGTACPLAGPSWAARVATAAHTLVHRLLQCSLQSVQG